MNCENKEKKMYLDITEEEWQMLYKTKDEQLADEVEWVWYDKELGKSLNEKRPSLSTIRQLQYIRKGYSHFFDIDFIKVFEQSDFHDLADWQVNALYDGIDITTERGWKKYLKTGIFNWVDSIDKFSFEFINGLERPLIFRSLLNVWGKHFNLEDWKNMREFFSESSEYTYNIFLKYSDMLGFIDEEFKLFRK